MGGTGKSLKEVKLGALRAPAVGAASMAQPGRKLGKLGSSGSGDSRFQHSSPFQSAKPEKAKKQCKIKFINQDRAIELHREDGSIEIHKLTK